MNCHRGHLVPITMYEYWLILYILSLFLFRSNNDPEKRTNTVVRHSTSTQMRHSSFDLAENFPNINMSESFWRVVVYLSLH